MAASTTTTPSSSQNIAPSSGRGRGGRGARVIRKVGIQPTQPTRLEAADDDPLGPLGSNAEPQVDEPPAPPQKEQAAPVRAQQPPPGASSQGSLRSMMDSVNLDDDASISSGPKQPPPVQPPAPQNGSSVPRQTQPSMSVLEAARPSFNIQVGDPHKVGDLTSSHTEYNVMTKVSCTSSIEAVE